MKFTVTFFFLKSYQKNTLGYSKIYFKIINRIYTCAPGYDYSHKYLWDLLLTKFFLIDISLMMKHFPLDWNNSFLKEKIMWFIVNKAIFNPFQANVPFRYTQKSSGKQRFSDVFRVYSIHIFYDIKRVYILRYFHVYIFAYLHIIRIIHFIHTLIRILCITYYIIFYTSCTTDTYTHIHFIFHWLEMG